MKICSFSLHLLLPALLGATSAFGLGFRIPDQGAAATARGNAFAATADDPSAIYYNPAGITQLTGTATLLGAYGIEFNTRVSLDAKGSKTFDNKYDPQAVPQIFTTFQVPHTPVTLGFGTYAPFGLRNKYADDVPFRKIAKEGSLEYITYNPVIAVAVSQSFSVAAGLTVNQGKTELVNGVIAPGDEFRFEGNDTAIGFNAGLMWKPHPMHSFGATYVSATSLNFDGTAHLRHDDVIIPVQIRPGLVIPYNAAPAVDQTQNAHGRFNLPQRVTLGYSFRPTPDWNLEVNVDWTDWERLNTVTLHQEKGPNVDLPFNWRSSFIYEFGVTRNFGNFHTSIGYLYSEQTVPNESFNPVIPDTSRHVFSLGVGQKFKRMSWDVAYQYAFSPERNVQQGTAVDGQYQFESHAVSLSLGYNF